MHAFFECVWHVHCSVLEFACVGCGKRRVIQANISTTQPLQCEQAHRCQQKPMTITVSKAATAFWPPRNPLTDFPSHLLSLNKVTALATKSCQKFAQQALKLCHVSLKPLFGDPLWATSEVMASRGRSLKSKITLAYSGMEELWKTRQGQDINHLLCPHHWYFIHIDCDGDRSWGHSATGSFIHVAGWFV